MLICSVITVGSEFRQKIRPAAKKSREKCNPGERSTAGPAALNGAPSTRYQLFAGGFRRMMVLFPRDAVCRILEIRQHVRVGRGSRVKAIVVDAVGFARGEIGGVELRLERRFFVGLVRHLNRAEFFRVLWMFEIGKQF